MISSAYSYYLSTYGSREVTNKDAHKKSELRSIYNNIIKINKKSPLYKVDTSPETQKYAIDLKENARAVISYASSVTSFNPDSKEFSMKEAKSSNNKVLTAKYIGNKANSDESLELDIHVSQLATPQTNTGNYVNPTGKQLDEGAYSFDLTINDNTYEFQFNVNKDDNNKSVQEKLARLINRSNIGLTANITENETLDSSLSLTSTSTGLSGFNKSIFNIANNEDNPNNAVSFLGLNNNSQPAQNALFTINGTETTSLSNNFTINKEFDVTLNAASESEEDNATISFKPSLDVVLDNVSKFSEKYNDILDLLYEKETNASNSNKLQKEFMDLINNYKNDFESSGITVDEKGHLAIDEALLIQSSNEGTLNSALNKLDNFKNQLLDKANNISLDPMNYVKKTLISYPNPIRSYSSPYTSSVYSGMMFNGYV